MTVIGRSTRWLHLIANSTTRGGSAFPNMDAMLQSLTSSLDLACRGYLCAPLVDCDPRTDPECGPTGKKLLIPDANGGIIATIGSDPDAKISSPDSHARSSLTETTDENLPRK